MSHAPLLLLMRHARPEPPGTGPDLERELSPQGLVQARRVGERLRSEAPDVVVSSPARRCRQTADEVVAGLGLDAPPAILVRDELAHDDASAILPELAAFGTRVLVVSHQPTLVALGVSLLRGAGPSLDLRPAQVAVLVGGTGSWRLRQFLDPPAAG